MAAAGFAVPAVDAPVAPSALTITAAPLQSGTLGPDDDLIIATSITNDTGATVTDATVSVYLDTAPLPSVSSLTSWLHPPANGTVQDPGTRLLQQDVPALASGASRSDALIVPAASLRLTGQAWGVHRLSVRVTSADTNAGEARSSVVWFPHSKVPQTRLALVMPITVPAETTGLIPSEILATYTAPGGVLDSQLSQAIGLPIALGIDPRIIASINILGTAAPETASAWLKRLRTADNETFELNYADSDIAALAQAGGIPPLDPITFSIDPDRFAPAPSESPDSPSPTTTPSPSVSPVPTLPTPAQLLDWDYTIDSLAWPGDNTVTTKNLDRFSADDLTTTILSSGNIRLPSSDALPAPTATVGKHRVAVSSATVSALVRKAVTADDDVVWRDAMTELSATLALATKANSDAPTIVTLGRAAAPPTFRLTQTLDALDGLPWAASATLSQALSTPAVPGTIVDKAENTKRLGLVTSMLNSEKGVGQFSSVLKDPTLVTGPQRLSLLAVLSHAWDSDPAGWQDAVTGYLEANRAIMTSVNIAESSPINLVADNGSLPIAVGNTLDHPVTVYLSVRPDRALLNVIKNHIEVTIEANSQTRVYIPVESVANGEVSLAVSLTSSTGVQVSQPMSVQVNVRADWERLLTGIIAGLLVAVFAFGIWRNLTKRRRARREAARSVRGTSAVTGDE
jgi:hypothetical protein